MLFPSVEFVDNVSDMGGTMNITVMESEEFQDRKRVRQKTMVYKTHTVAPSQSEYQHRMIKTQIPMEFWEMMHDFSMFLIVDDKHDLGRFSYYDRKGHFYRHSESPHHPSPFHHYQVGILGLFVSQVGAVVSKALEIKDELMMQGAPQSTIPSSFRVKREKPIIDLLPSYPTRALPPPTRLYDKLTQSIDSI